MMRGVKVCPACSREFGAGHSHCSDDGAALIALSASESGKPEALLGKVIEGRYRIERIIGRGGMGTVYACRHVVVGKAVAMKVLSPSVDRTEAVLQRFIREAQTTNLLRSRHFVQISDFGQLPSGLLFIVMELLEGQDLSRALRSGRLSRAEIIHVFIQVAEALAEAHDKGVVHRDLKPDNVFLVEERGDPLFVKLLDFGIAKITHGGPTGLTESGVILGTPYYMSPEQARGDFIDHRSDVYALGVMMYRAFTGRLPFVGDSKIGVLTRHITEVPTPPSDIGDVDLCTEQLILRCMQKEPTLRPQSMHEVGVDLRRMLLEEKRRQGSTPYNDNEGAARKASVSPSLLPASPQRAGMETPITQSDLHSVHPLPPPALPPGGRPSSVRPPSHASARVPSLPPAPLVPSFALETSPEVATPPAIPSASAHPSASAVPGAGSDPPDGFRPSAAPSDAITRLHSPNPNVTASALVRTSPPTGTSRRSTVIVVTAAVAMISTVLVATLVFAIAGRPRATSGASPIPSSAAPTQEALTAPLSAGAAPAGSTAAPSGEPLPALSAALPPSTPKPSASDDGGTAHTASPPKPLSSAGKPISPSPPARRAIGGIRSPFD